MDQSFRVEQFHLFCLSLQAFDIQLLEMGNPKDQACCMVYADFLFKRAHMRPLPIFLDADKIAAEFYQISCSNRADFLFDIFVGGERMNVFDVSPKRCIGGRRTLRVTWRIFELAAALDKTQPVYDALIGHGSPPQTNIDRANVGQWIVIIALRT